MTAGPTGRRTAVAGRSGGLLALTVLLAGWSAAPSAAQERDREEDPPRLQVVASAAVSIRESPDGLRLGRDARLATLRAEWVRPRSWHPWLEVGAFDRPELDCAALGDLPCSRDGWSLRAGGAIPLGGAERGRGLTGELLAGLGAGFGAETTLSYLLGIELQWALRPRILPLLTFRYERFPGITSFPAVGAGLRIDVL